MDRHPRWTLTFSDPDLIGWVTVAAYLVCALLLARAALGAKRQRGFWWLAMAVLLSLGINKQLDLHGLLTQTARDLFVMNGWYEWRRQAQALFVAGALGCSALLAWQAWRDARTAAMPMRLCMIGMAILATFVLVRLGRIYHAGLSDSIAGHGAVLPHLLELSGIAVIAASAIAETIRNGRGRRQ